MLERELWVRVVLWETSPTILILILLGVLPIWGCSARWGRGLLDDGSSSDYDSLRVVYLWSISTVPRQQYVDRVVRYRTELCC